MSSDILFEARPAMFKNNPIGFIVSIILIAAFGLGLIILFFWWLKCKNERIIVTADKVTKRTGIFSKNTNDIYLSDVKNIRVSQNLFHRMFKVGAISIASAGTAGIEISISGIPNPNRVKEIIDEQRRKIT